jgi:hypothetical protein
MDSLKETLLDPSRKQRVIDDCVALIDVEVANKGGLGGIAVKGAYAVVKKIKPGFVRDIVTHLLPDFISRLEPFYRDWRKQGGELPPFFASRQGSIADALLGVTDDKAGRAKNITVKKAYEKLRPGAQKHVEQAVPGIAQLLAAHAPPIERGALA